VWVADRSLNILARINPRTNRVTRTIRIGFDLRTTLEAGNGPLSIIPGDVWISNSQAGETWRVRARH
jgi:hypothetical protein